MVGRDLLLFGMTLLFALFLGAHHVQGVRLRGALQAHSRSLSGKGQGGKGGGGGGGPRGGGDGDHGPDGHNHTALNHTRPDFNGTHDHGFNFTKFAHDHFNFTGNFSKFAHDHFNFSHGGHGPHHNFSGNFTGRPAHSFNFTRPARGDSPSAGRGDKTGKGKRG